MIGKILLLMYMYFKGLPNYTLKSNRAYLALKTIKKGLKNFGRNYNAKIKVNRKASSFNQQRKYKLEHLQHVGKLLFFVYLRGKGSYIDSLRMQTDVFPAVVSLSRGETTARNTSAFPG